VRLRDELVEEEARRCVDELASIDAQREGATDTGEVKEVKGGEDGDDGVGGYSDGCSDATLLDIITELVQGELDKGKDTLTDLDDGGGVAAADPVTNDPNDVAGDDGDADIFLDDFEAEDSSDALALVSVDTKMDDGGGEERAMVRRGEVGAALGALQAALEATRCLQSDRDVMQAERERAHGKQLEDLKHREELLKLREEKVSVVCSGDVWETLLCMACVCVCVCVCVCGSKLYQHAKVCTNIQPSIHHLPPYPPPPGFSQNISSLTPPPPNSTPYSYLLSPISSPHVPPCHPHVPPYHPIGSAPRTSGQGGRGSR
jgi:hypothetical protein